ncbi:type IV pilus modification protein PilV [Pseudomonas sp. LP_7_YM]|uniref:type IV pilus modification protein PilV n=1 Tax=Pseudomonas sp. LP_7_YM TaxID=2485137 RepID=UPI0010DF305B|nr:type IV pilus modification protein PilV [Pseudomonas sp. LP_7_YM]TDV65793.1 type IV pilus assembly protein PilV [Pseudomonas sp. LP_7_YM]
MATGSAQAGVTLIEVLVALLVLSVGVLGVATLQLNALKHTDSAMRSTQVSFIVHDLLERIRANPQANYALVELSHAPTSGNPEIPRDQDLFDFADQLRRTVGDDAKASIAISGARVTVTLDWNDSRAQGQGAARQTMTLTSVTTPERGAHP